MTCRSKRTADGLDTGTAAPCRTVQALTLRGTLPVASSSSWPVFVARDRSASFLFFPGACPAEKRRRRGSVSRGLTDGVLDPAVGRVVGQAVRTEEDGDRTVGIFVDANRRFDEVWPQ